MSHQWQKGQHVEAYDFNLGKWDKSCILRKDRGSVTVDLMDGRRRTYKTHLVEMDMSIRAPQDAGSPTAQKNEPDDYLVPESPDSTGADSGDSQLVVDELPDNVDNVEPTNREFLVEPGCPVENLPSFWNTKFTHILGDTKEHAEKHGIQEFSSTSIKDAVDKLNSIDLKLEPEGVCYSFSRRWGQYFLIWRSDKTKYVAQRFDITKVPQELLEE